VFAGMSNAGQLAQKRDIVLFDMEQRRNRELKDQLDYLRQMKIAEEQERHNLAQEQTQREQEARLQAANDAKAKFDADKAANDTLEADRKPYFDAMGKPDSLSVDPVSAIKFQFGRVPQFATQTAQPPVGTADSSILSPEDEAARGTEFNLQFPMASPMDAASKLTAPPTDDEANARMSSLPLANPMSALVNRTSSFAPTLVPKDDLNKVFDDLVSGQPHTNPYEIVRGAELHDPKTGALTAGVQRMTPEEQTRQTLESKVRPSQFRDMPGADGTLRTYLISTEDGSKIDIGPAVPKPPTSASPFPSAYAAEKTRLGRELTADEVVALDLRLKKNAAAANPSGAASRLSNEAADMLARSFIATRQMPALGNNAALRQQVAEAAARLDPDANLAANSADFRSLTTSLSAVERQLSLLEPFERTAVANLDRAVGLAKPIVDSGIPLLNRPWRYVEGQLMGSPDQAKFQAARMAAYTEVARVLQSPTGAGVLSDHARSEAEKAISGDYTLEQLVQTAELIKLELTSRLTNLKEKTNELRQQLRGVGVAGGGISIPGAPGASGTPPAPNPNTKPNDPMGIR